MFPKLKWSSVHYGYTTSSSTDVDENGDKMNLIPGPTTCAS